MGYIKRNGATKSKSIEWREHERNYVRKVPRSRKWRARFKCRLLDVPPQIEPTTTCSSVSRLPRHHIIKAKTETESISCCCCCFLREVVKQWQQQPAIRHFDQNNCRKIEPTIISCSRKKKKKQPPSCN